MTKDQIAEQYRKCNNMTHDAPAEVVLEFECPYEHWSIYTACAGCAPAFGAMQMSCYVCEDEGRGANTQQLTQTRPWTATDAMLPRA